MRKLISLLLTLCMCLSVGLLVTACKDEEPSDPPSNPPCEATLTKADYIEVYSKVLNEVNTYVNAASQNSLMSISFTDSDFIEVPANQGKNAIKGNTAMLYLLRNLCNTSTFEIVDGFQDLIIIDDVSAPYEQTFKLRIKMSYDNQKGEIKSTVYMEDHSSADISISSLEFTFNYDFDSETLSGFTVLGIMGEKGNLTANGVNYLKYQNGTLYRINTQVQAFADFCNEVLQECAQIGASQFGNNLPDYSTQYIDAMMEAFS